VEHAFSFRRFAYAVSAMALVLAIGTVGFRLAIHETWLQSFYRAVVSSTLTGLDTVPRNDWARIVTIFLVLAGISIFAYIGSLVVEAIARGVIGGLWAERRRRRAIDALREHYIICGFGRVGQRVAEEFRHVGAQFVVVDYSPEAKAAAEEEKVLFIEGNGTDDDECARACAQALHHLDDVEVGTSSGKDGRAGDFGSLLGSKVFEVRAVHLLRVCVQ